MKSLIPIAACLLASLFPATAQLQSQIIKKFPAFGKSGEPVKVKFCPLDPSKVLAHVGQRECVIDVVKGKVQHFTQPGELVDWIGDQILMKNGDQYSLIQKDTLKPSKVAPLGAPALAQATATITTEKPVLLGRGREARVVRASDQKVLMKPPFRKGIYGFESNTQNTKWLLYYGDADYILYDVATKKKIALPKTPNPQDRVGFSAWKFSEDGSLIAEQGLPPEGVNPEAEEAVGRTRLFRFDLTRNVLEAIALPQELSNKALEVLDSGLRGHLFIGASTQGEKAANHGAYVLKILRPPSATPTPAPSAGR